MKTLLCFITLLLSHTIMAQTSAADNKPFETITFRDIPNGPAVFGVFEGRSPCPVLAEQLHFSISAECEKLKLEIDLYHDPASHAPTNYVLSVIGGGDVVRQQGGAYRMYRVQGQWAILKNVASYPGMEVVRLAIDDKGTELFLLKGDDNVLFILDKNKGILAGNEDFSYTLNRVALVAGKK
ncbi:MAG: hypothetical protein JST68_04750 [Bacteroidetes bacterium]|nr:hypothetical protein [Bacteroidota bacterium]